MIKTSWKFIAGFLGIIVLALIGLAVSNFIFNPESQDDRAAKKYLEELKAQYENDTYGGKTPEETLDLFVAALEKGDVELASKYFVLEKQEEMRVTLGKMYKSGNLKNLLELVHRDRFGAQLSENRYLIDFPNEQMIADFSIALHKYPQGIWKIEEL